MLASAEEWPEQESEANTLEAEAFEAWRALSAKVFMAISENPTGCIKHFEYRKALPVPFSSWKMARFTAFLGGLESFKITLCGGDDSMNLMGAYLGLVRQLEDEIFRHLHKVTRVEFVATSSGTIGGKGYHQVQLPFPVNAMSNVRHLHLEHVFIDKSLQDFLHTHASVLETVTLRNCYACLDPGNIIWSELFMTLATNDAHSLRRFELLPIQSAFHPYCAASQETRKRVEESLAADPSKRLFPVAFLDDEDGCLENCHGAFFESFYAKEDQRAWDELQNMIVHNDRAHA